MKIENYFMRRLGIYFIGIFLAIIIFSIFILRPWYKFINQDLHISLLKTFFSLDSLKTYNNQVNILLLGIPGGNYEGPDLSDSITVANYNFKSNRLVTVSIPRDIWSDTLQDKINSAYAYGQAKTPDGGIKLAKAEVAAIVGFPVQYGAVIDFKEFEGLIDFLGGLDIDIDRSFTDKKFPLPGKENDLCDGDPEYRCRYEVISFKKGPAHLDGQTALKFVRSRNAVGEEGSDFARGKRQQKVIEALLTKVLTAIKNFNLSKSKKINSQLNKTIHRDISNQQLAIIAKNILFKGKLDKKSFSLSDDLFEIPDASHYRGKYVLIPKNNDFSKLHQVVDCLLDSLDEKKCFQ